MLFRVNEGQEVPHLEGKPGGKAERRILVGGDTIEGPPWWIDEFRGRMTAIDPDTGEALDTGYAALSGDLATARAHERVTLLEEMIRRNPSLKLGLEPELAKAKEEADRAGEEFRAKQAARQAARKEADAKGKVVNIPRHGDPLQVRKVADAPDAKVSAPAEAKTEAPTNQTDKK